jgi:serine/threonine protein kinase
MNNYQLLLLLGAGLKASVHSAIRRSDGQTVAIKSFPTGLEALARKEFDTACLFTHRHLLRPEALTDEGIVMPYCSGRSVASLAGTLPEAVAWQVLAQTASALDYLKEQGYCQGAVCPANILWDGDHFLLADFGACHPLGEGIGPEKPEDFRYVAPEGPLDDRSDIWSLGASVFTLVLGNPVFNGLGGKAQRPESPVPYLRKSMPELSALLCRCMAYAPEERPSAKDLSVAAQEGLRQCLEHKRERALKPETEKEGTGARPDSGFWPDAMTDK